MHRLTSLLQLHHFPLNTWPQWIGQRQLQNETRNIQVLVFGGTYIRGLTVSNESYFFQPNWQTTNILKKHVAWQTLLWLLSWCPLTLCKLQQLTWKLGSQTSSIKCTTSKSLNVVVAQSIETRCKVGNEDVVGAVPTGDALTTSEWSTRFLTTKVCLILEVWHVWFWLKFYWRLFLIVRLTITHHWFR